MKAGKPQVLTSLNPRSANDSARSARWVIVTTFVLNALLLAALGALYFGYSPSLSGGGAPAPAERRLTLLTVNDVYSLHGASEGRVGGLARLRALRRWIEREAPNTLLLLAGDFLSPSLFNRKFRGKQMIDTMNHLDGKSGAFDPRMVVVFGNHEFDDSRCDREPAPLNDRVAEAEFLWLAANLDFSRCPSMKTLPDRPNVKDSVILDVGGVKLGIFGIGLTPDKAGEPRYPSFGDPVEFARRSIAHLRGSGAEAVVALTHLPREEDEALLREFAAQGLDLLVGGHDHNSMVLMDAAGQPRGFKADPNARTAWQIDLVLPSEGRPLIEARLIALNESIPPDPAVSKVADDWFAQVAKTICAERKAPDARENPDCLKEKIGRTQRIIELDGYVNRSQETGIGDWLADLLIQKTGADVAIINSGMLGLDDSIAAGSDLRLQHIVDIFRYDDVLPVRAFPAKLVCAAISHGFAAPGLGAWPHVGGVEVDIKQKDGEPNAAAVRRFLKHPELTCESDAEIFVVSMPFLLCGGDDSPLRAVAGENCVQALREKPYEGRPGGAPPRPMTQTFGQIVEEEIRRAGEAGIRPEKSGRLRFTTTN